MIVITLVCVGAVGIWALARTPSPVQAGGAMTPPDIEGVWTVVSARDLSLRRYGALTFQFDQGTLYGKSPCRGFRSDYRIEGDNVIITRPDLSGGLCDGATMEAEEAFARLIAESEFARMDDSGDLVLFGLGSEAMRIRRK